MQNQINQLTELDDRTNQIDGQAADYEENDQSESQIDLDNLTESQLIALQEQAAAGQVEFIGEDGNPVQVGVNESQGDDDEDDDVIDVDNPEDLAKKGLRRI